MRREGLLILVLVAVAACKSSGNSNEAVAGKVLAALQHADPRACGDVANACAQVLDQLGGKLPAIAHTDCDTVEGRGGATYGGAVYGDVTALGVCNYWFDPSTHRRIRVETIQRHGDWRAVGVGLLEGDR